MLIIGSANYTQGKSAITAAAHRYGVANQKQWNVTPLLCQNRLRHIRTSEWFLKLQRQGYNIRARCPIHALHFNTAHRLHTFGIVRPHGARDNEDLETLRRTDAKERPRGYERGAQVEREAFPLGHPVPFNAHERCSGQRSSAKSEGVHAGV